VPLPWSQVTKPKKHIPDYLSFTRKERTGIMIVLILIVLLTIFPFLLPFFQPGKKYTDSQFEKEIAALDIKQQDSSSNYKSRNFDENNYQNYYQPNERNYSARKPKGELFYFDPNTLSLDGWVKLGVREKTAITIQKYISKGGKFYKPEDISKIWGLHGDEVERLLPYVRIEQKAYPAFTPVQQTETVKKYDKPSYTIANVDINLADTAAFIALPGIGSKLANRIIAFRDKLGGFYKIEQVAETFALPDSTFQKIKSHLFITATTVKKISINKATVDELKAHPYLRYNLANAIVQYRIQHGAYGSVSDIKMILVITNDIFAKIEPYLSL